MDLFDLGFEASKLALVLGFGSRSFIGFDGYGVVGYPSHILYGPVLCMVAEGGLDGFEALGSSDLEAYDFGSVFVIIFIIWAIVGGVHEELVARWRHVQSQDALVIIGGDHDFYSGLLVCQVGLTDVFAVMVKDKSFSLDKTIGVQGAGGLVSGLVSLKHTFGNVF